MRLSQLSVIGGTAMEIAVQFPLYHMLRHTFTSNLLSNGAAPKDVQELLGHADVSTTMNIYAHSKREAKRTSARLLDKVVGET